MIRPFFALMIAALLIGGLHPSLLSPTASAAPACGHNTALDGLAGSATPVILVHGWTGSPMSATRRKLEGLPSAGERQYLLFNYADSATAWPDRPSISECLATYIRHVSDQHRARGGDGMVYLVAHSMGGLAIRFALDERYGRSPDLDRVVGGIVTLNTPYRGSMWGGSFLAQLISDDKIPEGFPPQEARAWHCLAGGPGKRLPNDCVAPPVLDPEVPLSQIAGEVTVKRTLFGLTAYTMNLASDGIVDTDSQHGSRDEDGSVGPNQTAKPLVSCTVNTSELGTALPYTWWSFFSDNTLMGMYAGKVPPELGMWPALETLARLMVVSSCSHTKIAEDSAGLSVVDKQLSHLSTRGKQLTSPRQLSELMIPADCQHSAEVIPGRRKDYGHSSDGTYEGAVDVQVERAVFGDLTGDGRSDAVVPMLCSAGGVAWPERLLVYGPGVRLLGSVLVGDAQAPREHADVRSMEFAGNDVSLDFTTYEGAGFGVANYRGVVRWENGRPLLDYGGGPLTVTYDGGTSTLPLGTGVVSQRGGAEMWVSPAPKDFRAFIQDTWADISGDPMCPATVSVSRYSHLGFAAGGVHSCGGYMAIWAKEDDGWEEIYGYQEGPVCEDLSNRAADAVIALGLRCMSKIDGQSVRLGREWPASGE